MATVFDVAQYILSKTGEMTAMKLQKLVYYSQAWSLAWEEKELFPEEIQAWAGGPVVPTLYERHRGMFKVSTIDGGDSGRLAQSERETIDRVVDFYGRRTAQWLSDLTHLEAPWINARERSGAGPGEFCRETITWADMAEYYSGLMSNEPAQTIA